MLLTAVDLLKEGVCLDPTTLSAVTNVITTAGYYSIVMILVMFFIFFWQVSLSRKYYKASFSTNEQNTNKINNN